MTIRDGDIAARTPTIAAQSLAPRAHRQHPHTHLVSGVLVLVACGGSSAPAPPRKTAPVPAIDTPFPAGEPMREAATPHVPGRAPVPAQPWDSLRPYITEGLDSRLPRPVGSGRWQLASTSPLDAEGEPRFVMPASERVLVQGARKWQLLAADGRSIAVDTIATSDLVIDPDQQAFFTGDRYGYLAAISLADGKVSYRATIHGVQTLVRQFFTRRGTEWFIASWEQYVPHAHVAARGTVLEVRDLGTPPRTQAADGRDTFLTKTRSVSLQTFEETTILAAVAGTTAFAVHANDLIITDLRLRLVGRYSSRFQPLGLSAADHRAYLLVREGERQQLWSVSDTGERQYSVELPADQAIAPRPPAIGFDHRAFVHGPSHVFCVGADGRLAWEAAAGADIAGIAIAPDDRLLVSAGSKLLAFDARGTRRVLWDFGADSLVTPPAMSRDGALYVASRAHLYRLTPAD
jgi:hypothetical protein